MSLHLWEGANKKADTSLRLRIVSERSFVILMPLVLLQKRILVNPKVKVYLQLLAFN
jgi:hypothetical protein